MKIRHALTTLAATPLLLAFGLAFDDLAFGPEDGSKTTREYSFELDFELDDLSVVADGQDMSEMVPGDLGATAEMMMTVTDHFVESDDGRPLELIRSFDEMSGETESMGESEEIADFTELAGKQVRFVWNEDDEAYEVAYHESEGDEDRLEGLSVDMDMMALLPDGEVDEGDAWTVEASKLGPVLTFGNELNMENDSGEEIIALIQADLQPQFEALLGNFETTCEYTGTRDEGGQSVGVIKVAMIGEGTIDLAPVIESLAESQGSEMDISLDISVAELDLTFEATGELLWDRSSGHMYGFSLDGEMEIGFEVDVSVDVGGESHSATADGAFLGTAVWGVSPSEE